MNDDSQYQYVQGQARPGFPALLADYEARSAAAAAGDCALDLRYGPHARQTFDFFQARGRPRGTLAYFHAGYWQSRDKSGFRFIAPAYAQAGVHVALVNYPLCPEVSLAALVEAAQTCVPAIRAQAGGDGGALVLAGHSAGAHVAIELALAQRDEPAIAGVAALSGIYALAPLLATTLNDKLRLDAASAHAGSPLYRVRPIAAPALFAVGATETPAFVAQSRAFHQAWTAAGNRGALHIEPEADHFSLLQPFASPGSALFAQVLGLLGEEPA